MVIYEDPCLTLASMDMNATNLLALLGNERKGNMLLQIEKQKVIGFIEKKYLRKKKKSLLC